VKIAWNASCGQSVGFSCILPAISTNITGIYEIVGIRFDYFGGTMLACVIDDIVISADAVEKGRVVRSFARTWM